MSFLSVNHSRGNGELESDAKSQLDRRLGELKQESNHFFWVKTCDLSYLFIYHSLAKNKKQKKQNHIGTTFPCILEVM